MKALVLDADTCKPVGMQASRVLVRESRACLTGAVPAYMDHQGEWQYVSPSLVNEYCRHFGRNVRIVYVDWVE